MSPGPDDPERRVVRFGAFEFDRRTKELHRDGVRSRLHGMPVEILAALVERPGDLVTRRELRGRLWPDDTFLDYENGLNNSVARLRDALGDSADSPRFIETLPKRGYRFIAPIEAAEPGRGSSLGPIRTPALPSGAPAPVDSADVTSAPADDEPLSPPTVPVGSAENSTPPGEARRPLTWLRAGAALLVVAGLGAVALVWQRDGAPAEDGRAMLAVLPFQNLSGSSDQDYLADAFTEEVITQLARVSPDRLGVIARTTVMRYANTGTDIAKVGRDLSVDYVIEGSVREVDGTLRVTAQLIRVADQTHLWAETFDRTSRSLLDVERGVSEAVSRQVLLAVDPLTTPPARADLVPHPDAHAAYLRARYHHLQATVQGIENAIAFYRASLTIDSNYALAYAGLARAYIFGVRMRPLDALKLAHEAARKALELDPELPEAQLAVAMAKLYYEWDWTGSEREFRRAIERDPGSADAHFYYSHLLAALGRHDEAIASARRAQQLDPYSTLIGHYVGRHLFMARRYDEALSELRRTLDLDPNYSWTHVFLFLTYEQLGRTDDALRHRQKYLTLIGRGVDEAEALDTDVAGRGYSAVVERWIAITLGYFKASGHLTSAEVVHGYAALKRTDEAFEWLERAFDDHTRDLIYLGVDPGFDPLRRDPRFSAYLDRMRLPRPPSRS